MADYWGTDEAGAPAPPAGQGSRWWPLFLVALILAIGIGAYLTRGEAAGADVLRVGSQKGSTKAMMLASGALEGAPYRIEWSEFPAAQNLIEAIGAGAVDVGLVGDAPFLFAYQSGSPIKAVQAQTAPTRPAQALAILVPKSSPIRRIGDLVGKRVATTRGSIGHYLLLSVLLANRLPASAVDTVFLAPGDAKAAFSSGSIDAWAVWNPYLAAGLEEGARIVADGRDYLSGYGFDAASDAAIAGKRAILADYLRREGRALAWANANPEKYAAVLAADTGLPLSVARFTVLHGQRVAVPIDDRVLAEERDVLARFTAAGALVPKRPIEDAFLSLGGGG